MLISAQQETRTGADVTITNNQNDGGIHSDKFLGLSNVQILGLDCEMVGVGPGGVKSVLARCSIVQFHPAAPTPTQSQPDAYLGYTHTTLYDTFIKTNKKITDYRTIYSGITPEDLRGEGNLPVVTLEECQRHVKTILSGTPLMSGSTTTTTGRTVPAKTALLCGHALHNDFEVLQLKRHPEWLTRDTATYHPLMRPCSDKYRPHKLRHLVKWELGLKIQDSENGTLGHDSTEDAVAATRLYLNCRGDWEKGLGYPLRELGGGDDDDEPNESEIRSETDSSSRAASGKHEERWGPLTLHLDGCNLPLGLRPPIRNNDSTLPSIPWQLVSKQNDSAIDWIPRFHTVASKTNEPPYIQNVEIYFDGAKYQDNETHNKEGTNTKLLVPESKHIISDRIQLRITPVNIEVDDVLVHEICGTPSATNADSARILTLTEAIQLASNAAANERTQPTDADRNKSLTARIPTVLIVTRIKGGTKTHKVLFQKLNLRRGDEGALCLPLNLTVPLTHHSLRTLKQLRHAGGKGGAKDTISSLIRIEQRDASELRHLVITEDVLLTHRIVNQESNGGENSGGVVLNFEQLQHLV